MASQHTNESRTPPTNERIDSQQADASYISVLELQARESEVCVCVCVDVRECGWVCVWMCRCMCKLVWGGVRGCMVVGVLVISVLELQACESVVGVRVGGCCVLVWCVWVCGNILMCA